MSRTVGRSFRDRRDAGRQLGDEVARRGFARPVVVALPRGGVPVAAEVARRLSAPLDVLIVRKIGCPGRRELAIGAIAEGDVRLDNDRLIADLDIAPHVVDAIAAAEREEADRRARRYRGDRAPVDVRGRTAIVVDDGLATGFTARAAVAALRTRRPAHVVLAVPVAPPAAVADLRTHVEVICLRTPEPFWGVGRWYDDFSQVGDEEVTALLGAD